MSKYENLIFHQHRFILVAAILVAILKKKVDKDGPGIEPILHRENLIKIHCCLGGVGQANTRARARTHTHTHRGLRKVPRIYSPWTLASHE